jgi:hypothetical protein
MTRLRVALTLAVLTVLAAALAPLPARGERSQSGNLIVALNGGINPLKLPRQHSVPVAVRLEGKIGTADGSPLPQVKRVEIELAGPGLLYTRGLGVCPRPRLSNANDQQALNRCGPALVGRGSLGAQVAIPHQAPFAIHAHLLAFNGRTAAGRPAIWVHAFSSDPPISLVLPFVVHPGGRAFPTILVAAVPRSVGPLPRLAVFHLSLFRRFSFRGRRHSYISATCPVPPSLTAGFLTFARATYSFAGDRQVQVESVRSCRASG